MNLTDWLFIPLLLLTLVTLMFLLVLGATVAFPKKWDAALREAAHGEVRRRFEGFGLRSQSDLIAASRIVGVEATSTNIDGDTASAVLDVVLVLTNESDRPRLDVELEALRSRLECAAIDRQIRVVAQVQSIRIASYLWVATAWFHRACFALAGFLWFFPRTLPFLGRRLQKHGGVLGIIGIVVGLLWAAVARATTPEGSPFDWFSIVSNVGLVCAIAGMVSAVLGLYKAVLVTRFGPCRQWTPRGIITGSALVLFLCAFLVLSWSGTLATWQKDLTRWARTLEMTDEIGRWIGGLALALAASYGLRNAYRQIRNRGMTLSGRLWVLACSPLLLVMLVLLGFFVLDIPFANAFWVLMVASWTVALLGAIAAVAECVEWVRKYRMLKRLGILVPRRGFRWWGVLAWVTTGIVLNCAHSLMSASGPHAENPVLFSSVLSVLNLLIGVWMLALFPGLLVTALYVRRNAKAYEQVRFRLAPPHPRSATSEVP